MQISAIDLITVLMYMLFVIYIGIRATKRVKNTEDFFLAGRSLSKWQAGCSLAATDMGASVLVGAAGWGYTQGYCSVWWCWSAIPGFIIMAELVGRLRQFRLTTVPEYLEWRYGPHARVISAVIHAIGTCMYTSSQGVVAAYTLSTVTGWSQPVCLVVGMLIIILYTYFGGLRAVVYTDIAQFIVMMVAVTIMGAALWTRVGGMGGMTAALPESYFDAFANGIQEPISFVFFCIFVYGTGQYYVQRVFSAKDVGSAKFAYRFSAVAYVVMGLGVLIVGMGAKVIFPEIENSDMVLPVIIRDVMPVGLAGLTMAALFAACMSSADSYLSAASTLITVDLYKRFFKPDESEDHYLKVSRIVVLGVGTFAIIFGLQFENVIKMIVFAGTMYSASVFAPFYLGMFWKGGTPFAASTAIIVAALVTVGNKYFGLFDFISPILAGGITAAVVFILVSFVTPKSSPEQLEYMYAYQGAKGN
ncbi:MAG: sodium:solute symporter family protein [Desulfobacterales bacterium]|nr:sodium:solute symporter family protein [Desulfobacterales bacterium]